MEKQFIYRRRDGALWPTFVELAPRPAWTLIRTRDVGDYHEIGDTILIYRNIAETAEQMPRGSWKQGMEDHAGIINFTGGDHLSDEEKDHWLSNC